MVAPESWLSPRCAPAGTVRPARARGRRLSISLVGLSDSTRITRVEAPARKDVWLSGLFLAGKQRLWETAGRSPVRVMQWKCREAAWPPWPFCRFADSVRNTGFSRSHPSSPASGPRRPLFPSREAGGSLASDGGLRGPAPRPFLAFPLCFSFSFLEWRAYVSHLSFFFNVIYWPSWVFTAAQALSSCA